MFVMWGVAVVKKRTVRKCSGLLRVVPTKVARVEHVPKLVFDVSIRPDGRSLAQRVDVRDVVVAYVVIAVCAVVSVF